MTKTRFGWETEPTGPGTTTVIALKLTLMESFLMDLIKVMETFPTQERWKRKTLKFLKLLHKFYKLTR